MESEWRIKRYDVKDGCVKMVADRGRGPISAVGKSFRAALDCLADAIERQVNPDDKTAALAALGEYRREHGLEQAER